MGSSAAPAPDYHAQAVEQGQLNKDSADYNTELNRVNQVGPNGTVNWSQTPGADGGAAQWTQTTTLSPELQQQQNQANTLANSLLSRANAAPAVDTSTLNTRQTVQSPTNAAGVDMNAVQSALDSAAQARSHNASASQIAGTAAAQAGESNPGQDIQRTFDTSKVTAKIPDSIDNAYMQSVQDALMSRLAPTQQRDTSALRTRLLNSGIEVGSDAYNREIALDNQRQNDARMQAVIQSGSEGRSNAQLQANLNQQQFGQALDTGKFAQSADTSMAANQVSSSIANAANRTQISNANAQRDADAARLQAQMGTAVSSQNAGQETAVSQSNAAQANNQNQNLANALINGAATNSNINNANTVNRNNAVGFNNNVRDQDIQEQITLANQPLNQLNSLRTGSQIQGPNAAPIYTGGNAQAAPVFDAAVQQGNYNTAANAADQSGTNALLGAGATVGAAFMMY